MTFTVTPKGLTGILAEVKDLTINMIVHKLDDEEEE